MMRTFPNINLLNGIFCLLLGVRLNRLWRTIINGLPNITFLRAGHELLLVVSYPTNLCQFMETTCPLSSSFSKIFFFLGYSPPPGNLSACAPWKSCGIVNLPTSSSSIDFKFFFFKKSVDVLILRIKKLKKYYFNIFLIEQIWSPTNIKPCSGKARYRKAKYKLIVVG